MTIDEAIKHCEEVAHENEKQFDGCPMKYEGAYANNGKTACKCAEEHRQLAEWLKNYKRLLEQEPCEDVPDINSWNIYECSCGYGWDKTKVVRHHFCPNCGMPVDKRARSVDERVDVPVDDCISRQAVLDQTYLWSKDEFLRVTNPFDYLRKRINALPPATPQPKTGHWIGIDEEPHEDWECDNCGFVIWADESIEKFHYCPNCGAKMVEPQESEG